MVILNILLECRLIIRTQDRICQSSPCSQVQFFFIKETTRDENAPHTKYLAAYLRQNLIPIRRPHKSEPTILTELSENDQREL